MDGLDELKISNVYNYNKWRSIEPYELKHIVNSYQIQAGPFHSIYIY